MRSDESRRRQAEHLKTASRVYTFRLFDSTDADLIEFLDGLDNRQAWLKKIMRAELEKYGK